MHIRHTLCTTCGSYKGVKLVDMTAIIAKKAAKKKQRTEAVAGK
jgi:hypothetical protein